MERSTNALAELAEVMDKPVDMASIHDSGLVVLNARQFNAYQKAQRIVAELAKVNTLGPKHIPGDISLYTAYAKCRAVAEEGAKDGK